MPALFLNGNTNQYTFANAALAAHLRDIREGGSGLSVIFVLHSPQSEEALTANKEWRAFLKDHQLDPSILMQFTVELADGKMAIARAAEHLKRCVDSVDKQGKVYVDLTNGTSLYKSILANIAYLLGVDRAFYLDTALVYATGTGPGRPRMGFFSEKQLEEAYVDFPDPALLDAVAPAWLTEVRRFSKIAREASRVLASISETGDAEISGFELTAVQNNSSSNRKVP